MPTKETDTLKFAKNSLIHQFSQEVVPYQYKDTKFDTYFKTIISEVFFSNLIVFL